MYTSLSALGKLFSKMIAGIGAVIIQFYDEVNKKRGLQWEVSRTVPLASTGLKVYSVLRVGAKHVDLKSRVLGATGGGVIGAAYRLQPSDVTFSGSPDLWSNYNSAITGQPLTKIYPSAQVTFNTPVASLAVEAKRIHAKIHAFGSQANNGKGFTPAEFGGNHILNPNDIILLEIESFDADQTASAKLDIHEGDLDYYPE
jgi:hypothetical protein